MLLRPVLDSYDVRYVVTHRNLGSEPEIDGFDTLPDCNMNTPFRAIACAVVAVWLVLRHRPQVLVTTGSAPGFFCLLAGRLVGVRTLWIDSVANGEELSLSGKLALVVAHECWTQWEHLASANRPQFHGAVL
jgi:UDP-N-acetylglucosamine:LPS N-acetylglucosamine transferase